MKTIHSCPTCKKPAVTKTEIKILNTTIRTYMCNHVETFVGAVAAPTDTLDIVSLDGKHLFPYQLEGARFAEAANMRCGIFDDMGVGKTVQAASVLVAHKETWPFLGLVKSGLRMQWNKELIRWGDLICQIIDGANTPFLKGMNGYILSQDTAWRIGWRAKSKKEKEDDIKRGDHSEYVKIGPDLTEWITKLGIKIIIIDECQQIKNMQSKRTKAIQKACAAVPHVLALSGTPIEKNAAEYFPILNILRPDKFPNENAYIYGWCDTFSDGYSTRTGGLKRTAQFKEYTKDFIIRRKREDVLPDLPRIFRQNHFSDLGSEVNKEYEKTQREFNDAYDSGEFNGGIQGGTSLLGYLAKMRHLTGLSKIQPTVEYVEEFITTTDRKLCIFVHHKDVGAILATKLAKIAADWPAEWGKGILQLTSELDMYQRQEVVEQFASSDYRIMVASTLASSEGLNLQFCSDCILMERQWNPAKEEQAEARFPRPGSTADKINALYSIAVGTIDEFFTEIVEKKRTYVGNTLDGTEAKWDETSIVKELADVLRQRGGGKWGF
jgi:SNF2 family DNA or RNA helicase